MTKNRFVQNTNLVMQNNEVYVVCGDEHSADVVTTALNELINENEQLKNKLSETKEILRSIEKDRTQTLLICEKYEGFFKEKGYNIQDLIDYARDGSND